MKRQILLLVLTALFAAAAFAQGSAFSFQGRLNDGTSPANGRYDLQFKLFDAATGGAQIGPTVARPGTTLINGIFSTTLDFGAVAFQNPNATFIEIAVKPFNSPNSFTILGPRQQLTVVPYASRAQNATVADNSTNLGGITASEYITRTNGGADFIRNSTQTQANSNFNISGTGIINGNLSVGGNQSLVGNLTSSGSLQIGGNARQDLISNGLVKAMIHVNANASVIRCYNGVTGASTGNCGFSVVKARVSDGSPIPGMYEINFGFAVNARFVTVTALQTRNLSGGVNIGTGFFFEGATNPFLLTVRTFISDIQFDNSLADNPFMIIVY